jgi:hypothetical protein
MTANVARDARKEEQIKAGRLLSQDEVLRMWPITREYLSRLTNHRNADKRLPSYRLGRRRFYSPDELMWFREKNRYEPTKRRGKK